MHTERLSKLVATGRQLNDLMCGQAVDVNIMTCVSDTLLRAGTLRGALCNLQAAPRSLRIDGDHRMLSCAHVATRRRELVDWYTVD